MTTSLHKKLIRPIKIERHFLGAAAGSALISMGNTKVICAASIEDRIPPFLKDCKQGWVTGEYSMLPASTKPRTPRELNKGKPSGRTHEIQRLIGRALRSVVKLEKLGERTIHLDCDVIQADGGTRTAAITGSMVALYDAVQTLLKTGQLTENPIAEFLAAVSVGVVNGEIACDLCYEQDVSAEVDMNIVMTESGRYVEVQGTGEKHPFEKAQFQQMLVTAEAAIMELIQITKATLSH